MLQDQGRHVDGLCSVLMFENYSVSPSTPLNKLPIMTNTQNTSCGLFPVIELCQEIFVIPSIKYEMRFMLSQTTTVLLSMVPKKQKKTRKVLPSGWYDQPGADRIIISRNYIGRNEINGSMKRFEE